MKAVLDSRPGSGYRDSDDRYHFPARYLGPIVDALGDWVILYEPRRAGGRAAYIAAARISQVIPDPEQPGQHYASLTDRLPFDAPVSFRGPVGYREAPLRAVGDLRAVGRALQGRSARALSDEDFAAIVAEGLGSTLAVANRKRLDLDDVDAIIREELLDGPPDARRFERVLASRVVREASFRHAVLDAYDDTCAVTGIRIVNGGGRAEAQAAHIMPVALGGPDIVQNGIALSATAHWLFDRHLISIGDDWRLLVSHNKVPEEVRGLLSRHAQGIRLPANRTLWPAQAFMQQHRDRFANAGQP